MSAAIAEVRGGGVGRISRAAGVWLLRESAPEYGGAPSDDDALTSLGEEIMTLSERVAAETHRLLQLIAEFERLKGWRLHGFASCADWLAYATRIDRVTAREKVRVARALAGLPETSAAMARGDLSFSQVRAITRVADEETECELLEHARTTSAAGLERLCRSWRRLGREDEEALERRRHESRCLSVFPDEQGMYLIRGRLDPEVGALLMRAIEAASDVLYRGSVPDTTPEQRRADALALLAERAMAASLSDVGAGASAEAPEAAPVDENATEGSEPAGCEMGVAASRAERYMAERYLVVLHVDGATLAEGQEPGRSDLEDGTRVSAETSRRLACDASVLRVTHGANELETRVEGRTRTVPLRLRRALEVRDRGCRFPGCGSRFTDAHHIRHWADGGKTRLDNLILLCRVHHRLLHEGGFRLEPKPERPGRPTFVSSRGIPIPDVPPRMRVNRQALPGDASSDADRPRWEEDVSVALYLRMMSSLSG